MDKAKTKPLQAALTSNANAFVAPIAPCTRDAQEGLAASGVIVATMINSMDSGERLLFSTKRFAAIVAKSLVVCSFAQYRVLIPVLFTIHSSEVSTRFAQSSFVITDVGR